MCPVCHVPLQDAYLRYYGYLSQCSSGQKRTLSGWCPLRECSYLYNLCLSAFCHCCYCCCWRPVAQGCEEGRAREKRRFLQRSGRWRPLCVWLMNPFLFFLSPFSWSLISGLRGLGICYNDLNSKT